MITLYTIDCPKCKVLEKKLREKDIPFEINKDSVDNSKLFSNNGVKSCSETLSKYSWILGDRLISKCNIFSKLLFQIMSTEGEISTFNEKL